MTDHAQDAIMADAVLSEHEDPSLLAGMLNNRAIFWGGGLLILFASNCGNWAVFNTRSNRTKSN